MHDAAQAGVASRSSPGTTPGDPAASSILSTQKVHLEATPTRSSWKTRSSWRLGAPKYHSRSWAMVRAW